MEIRNRIEREKRDRLDRLIDSSLKGLNKDQFVNDITAAKILACSPQSLRNWRCLRKGPPYTKAKDGRMIRYRVGDLIRYMEDGRIDPEGQREEL